MNDPVMQEAIQGATRPQDRHGGKDCVTLLPGSVIEPVQAQQARVRLLRERDLEEGEGEVELPDALMHNYQRAAHEWL